ncbi:High mobility group box 1 [Coemansia sp. RSA 1972]|nr:High mobility group box 1 [Coemansia sp. RSA 1972]
MRSSQSDAHVEHQPKEPALNGVITRDDARVVGPKTGVTHRVRDPNRPKRPPTAYILFSLDRRAGIAARNEGMRSQDVAVEIGKEWRKMSKEERQEYQIEADVRREKFFADIAAYEGKKALANGGVESDDEYQPPTNGIVSEPEVQAPASNGTHTDDASKKTKKKKSSDPNSTKKKARKSKSGHEGGEEAPKKKKKSKQPAEAT